MDINEKSLAEEGRWPWSRDKLAILLDNLFDHYKATVVGFDVVFAEKDESSGLKVLERLGRDEFKDDARYRKTLVRMQDELDYDRLFAGRMGGRNVVLGYYFTNPPAGEKPHLNGGLPPPVFARANWNAGNTRFVRMAGYGANLPELQQRAHSAGHFNPFTDPDGVTRRIPVLIEHGGAFYEALSIAMVRALLGDPPLAAGFPKESSGGEDYRKLEWLSITDMKIPVEEQATALIPYRGRQGSFRYVSAADVLHQRARKADLEGAVVLVGTTAPGLMDLRSTPVAAVYPGVEIHANMIAGILDQTIKQKPAYVMGAELMTLLIAGVMLALWLPFLSPLKATGLSLVTLASIAALNGWAWHAHMVLPLASSALMVPLLFAWNMSYGFFVESRAKRQITGLFGQYVPRELVLEMSHSPEKFTMEGESREMTVLFCDVRNFTTISEGLSPRDLSQLMNEYMTPMTRTIQKHRGTIDKYIGDAIMAFWGAPLADENHARNGVLAALEMQEVLAELRARFIERGWPEVRIGIGLNSGVMSVGNMGSEFRVAYTVLGDAVNLSSRLEGLTKEYGVGVMCGEITRQAVPEIVWRELDRSGSRGRTSLSPSTSRSASKPGFPKPSGANCKGLPRPWNSIERWHGMGPGGFSKSSTGPLPSVGCMNFTWRGSATSARILRQRVGMACSSSRPNNEGICRNQSVSFGCWGSCFFSRRVFFQLTRRRILRCRVSTSPISV